MDEKGVRTLYTQVAPLDRAWLVLIDGVMRDPSMHKNWYPDDSGRNSYQIIKAAVMKANPGRVAEIQALMP
jgi:hypothetical protein